LVRVGEIVKDEDIVAKLSQDEDDVGPDVSGPARHQDRPARRIAGLLLLHGLWHAEAQFAKAD
jgi:hypothetical protein